MAKVTIEESFEATVHEAETCWCDARRWPEWVDECARVVSLSAQWPDVGGEVVWESGPAGRGRVVERMVEHEPLHGLVLEVSDDSIEGRQSVWFTPAGQGVELTLSLDYKLRQRSLFALLGGFFIRRAMRDSMAFTLERFGAVLSEARSSGVG